MKPNPIPGRRYHVRCKLCDARRVFKRHIDDYIRLPACRLCGNRTWRPVKQKRTRTCVCDGYWFPHRWGSLYCHHNPDYRHRDDNQDERQYTLY